MAEFQHDPRRTAPKSARTSENPARAAHTNETLKLQGMIGNQALQRLLMQGGAVLPSGRAMQAKLTVTSADNASEREADAVADQVVQRMDGVQRAGDDELARTPDQRVMQREGEEEEVARTPDQRFMQREGEEEEVARTPAVNVMQREGEEEEVARTPAVNIMQREGEEEEVARTPAVNVMQREGEEELEREAAPQSLAGSFDVDAQLEQRIDSERGKGQALPDNVQRSMGTAFGADFSGVRVHTDSTSDELSSSVGARAFTTGSDLFFREGEYQPESSSGKRLLAHELTHTIQQNAVSRKKGTK